MPDKPFVCFSTCDRMSISERVLLMLASFLCRVQSALSGRFQSEKTNSADPVPPLQNDTGSFVLICSPVTSDESIRIKHFVASALRWNIKRKALTRHTKEVINGGYVINGVGEDADLLLPLLLEQFHIVLGHLTVRLGSKS